MELKELVAATANAHKLAEIRAVLPEFIVRSESEAGFFGEVEETGDTFRENALLKARAVCKATGKPALADDSGLCVDALGGAPGVYSARFSAKYAPESNLGNKELLLKRLEGQKNRRAFFCCCAALVFPDGREICAEGKTFGEILTAPRGENGFGYDPLFLSDDLGVTFAEASEAEKNAVSHRGRALRALKEAL